MGITHVMQPMQRRPCTMVHTWTLARVQLNPTEALGPWVCAREVCTVGIWWGCDVECSRGDLVDVGDVAHHSRKNREDEEKHAEASRFVAVDGGSTHHHRWLHIEQPRWRAKGRGDEHARSVKREALIY